MDKPEVIVMANGRAALIKEYGNLGMGFVISAMLMVVLWKGLEMGQRFLDGQLAVFQKMVDNQTIDLEQNKARDDLLAKHYDQVREILDRSLPPR